MCPADTPADAPVDDLQRMLADKAARRVADEQTRMRIAAEVDVAMDNGVHINPLLRQAYGERSREAAPAAEGASQCASAVPPPVASAHVAASARSSVRAGGSVDDLELDF